MYTHLSTASTSGTQLERQQAALPDILVAALSDFLVASLRALLENGHTSKLFGTSRSDWKKEQEKKASGRESSLKTPDKDLKVLIKKGPVSV